MDLKEITELISIRQYVINSMGNFNVDRKSLNELNGLLLLLDKRIVELLLNEEFKEYIGYKDVKKAIEEVARLSNIKSGIKK